MWKFLKKLEIELPYNPAIPLLGIHTKETRIEPCPSPTPGAYSNSYPLPCLLHPPNKIPAPPFSLPLSSSALCGRKSQSQVNCYLCLNLNWVTGYPGIFFFLLSCPSPILFNDLELLLSLTYVVSSFLADSPLTLKKKLLILHRSIAWRIPWTEEPVDDKMSFVAFFIFILCFQFWPLISI